MTEKPIQVFVSYSHQDEKFKDELVKHLSSLQRQGVISGWHDRMIVPGSEWDREIDAALSSADIILLLVSPDFLASEYCWGVEVRKAMQRHEAGEACVIPVVLRWSLWTGTPFAKFQALPKNAKPIASWSDRDEAFYDVARGIAVAVEKLRKAQQQRREAEQQATERTRLEAERQAESPQMTAADFFNRGWEKRQKGDNKGAIADYDQAIKLRSDDALAYNNRGNARSDLGDKQGAIADYNQAIEINNNWGAFNSNYYGLPTAYYNRGIARSALGDKQGAIADYDQAIKLKSDYANAYNSRGNARSDLGDKQGAIADYDQAIKLKSDHANAYYNRGLRYKERGEKQRAMADFQKAVDLYQQQGNTEWHQNALNRLKELQS